MRKQVRTTFVAIWDPFTVKKYYSIIHEILQNKNWNSRLPARTVSVYTLSAGSRYRIS